MPAQKNLKSDDYLFKDQNPLESEGDTPLHADTSWRVLIVDDEPEVHQITTMALSGVVVIGRPLEFLFAHSAKEAFEILNVEKDIAVVLLDVVMESDHAGLDLIHVIRHKLQLESVRIILRTGQPGQAPEEKVVLEYDINDYIMKTEMTRNKLLTSVCAAIRGYQQIQLVTQSKEFLEKLTEINTLLISQNSFCAFTRCLVQSSISLFRANGHGLILLNEDITKDEMDSYKLEFSTQGVFEVDLKEALNKIDSNLILKVEESIKSHATVIADDNIIFYIPGKSCSAILILNETQTETLRSELIDSFIATISSGLDSAMLLEQISEIAYTDSLTQLPNRTRFIQHLDDLTGNEIDVTNTAVLIDIEHFSDVNDGLGQDTGNFLLQAVANRLSKNFDKPVVVARVGADVFGLIGTESVLERQRLLKIFATPFLIGESSIAINVNIGIWHKKSKVLSGLDILKQANIALNLSKKDDQNRAVEYMEEMEDETSWRLHMIRRLTEDFHAGKLEVWYQPQISLEKQSVIGVEALLRWPDGKGGFISPLTFIPLAEYSGLINQIGHWVLEQACQEVIKIEALGYKNFRMAVNVSVPQFKNPHFVEEVVEVVNKYGVSPTQIELEITESVVMDDTNLVVSALNQLRELGFTVAIDDFGTGFSSLSYLHKLPLNRLKIDREFIRNIGKEGEGVLAETIISLGQKLGLVTIAEGIETQHQLDYVSELGCNEAQGFYHAKPMPSAQLLDYLKQVLDK